MRIAFERNSGHESSLVGGDGKTFFETQVNAEGTINRIFDSRRLDPSHRMPNKVVASC